jgi:hypothetical protein
MKINLTNRRVYTAKYCFGCHKQIRQQDEWPVGDEWFDLNEHMRVWDCIENIGYPPELSKVFNFTKKLLICNDCHKVMSQPTYLIKLLQAIPTWSSSIF